MGRSKVSPLRIVSMAANVMVVVTVVAALYLAQDVFIPLTLSTMLAFLLAPLADRLENWGLRRAPAVIVLAVLAFTIIGGFLWIVGREATKLAADIPKYQSEIISKVENFSTVGAGTSKRMTQFVTAVSEALRGNKAPKAAASRSSASELPPPVEDPGTATPYVPEATDAGDNSKDPKEPLGTPTNPIHTVSGSGDETAMGTALGAATAVLAPLTNVGLVIVFTIFMLISRDDLRDRLIRVLSGGRYIVTTKAIDEASRRISSYILAQTFVNSLYGLCIGIGLWTIGWVFGEGRGFPNFALWGLLCTVLRFVPYLGPIIGGAFPVMLSLIVFPGFLPFLATAALFTSIELLSNNVIEPWLYGSSTGLSPMAVILAAVFWTWMWGPVGLLLAIPLTASLVVLGKYVPQLQPLSVLLGDRTPLPPDISFYQRLLADDNPRAAKILDATIEESDLESAADDVLLPTIRRIRRDRAAGELSAPREHRLMQTITGMIDDVLSAHCRASAKASDSKNESEATRVEKASQADSTAAFASGSTESKASAAECATKVAQAVQDLSVSDEFELDDESVDCTVLGCTAHHESEEPVLKVLSYCLGRDNVDMRWTGTKALPSDIEAWAEAQRPPVIVIAIVPPEGLVQAKYLCQRLHAASPTSQIIVVFFGKLRSYDSVLLRFRSAGARYFATSLTQARTQVGNALQRRERLQGRGEFAK